MPEYDLRLKTNFASQFKLIWVVQSPRLKIFRFRFDPNHRFDDAISFRQEGRIARRHERGTGCGGRGSVVAPAWWQGGFKPVSHHRRERTNGAWALRSLLAKTGCCVRQNRVVPTPVAGAKSAEANRPNRVS